VWQKILKIRSLVLDPTEDTEVYLKYANLCVQSGRPKLAYKVFTATLHLDPPSHLVGTRFLVLNVLF
jgi:FKBP12-rapamycin complex-associated protein